MGGFVKGNEQLRRRFDEEIPLISTTDLTYPPKQQERNRGHAGMANLWKNLGLPAVADFENGQPLFYRVISGKHATAAVTLFESGPILSVYIRKMRAG